MKLTLEMEGITPKKALLAYFMGQALAGLSAQIVSTPIVDGVRTQADWEAEQDRMHDVACDAHTIAKEALELWEEEA
jgi:hypothetical protein